MRTLLLSFLIGTAFAAGAQNESSVHVTDFNLYFGSNGQEANTFTQSDLMALSPAIQDDLLYQEDDYFSNGFSNAPNFTFKAMIGLRFDQKGTEALRNNPTLRIGITYDHVTALDYYRGSSETYRIDTLTSSQNGNQIYVDSIARRSVSVEYISERFALDASLIFRTSQEKNLSFYAGLGLSAGLSFNNRTEYFVYQSSNLDQDGLNYGFEAEEREGLVTGNEGGMAFGAYLP
ncbi:MAG: hypothetical protein HKN79_10190, partial [Flavobacteriales bacterium]|nr:hypothetical protein [Flavobacteriales bacterium]